MTKRKRFSITRLRFAIGLSALTTLFGMITSAMNAISEGGASEERLYYLAMWINLGAYSILIMTIMNSRKSPVSALTIVDEESLLSISPCRRSQVIVFDQTSVDGGPKKIMRKYPPDVRRTMRVAVVRSLTVTESLLDILVLFPNLTVLDLQASDVSPSFWDELEVLDSLSHALIYEAIDTNAIRSLTISLPEVRFWNTPKKLAIHSKLNTNPSAALSVVPS